MYVGSCVVQEIEKRDRLRARSENGICAINRQTVQELQAQDCCRARSENEIADRATTFRSRLE
jgi:hypothetical protein